MSEREPEDIKMVLYEEPLEEVQEEEDGLLEEEEDVQPKPVQKSVSDDVDPEELLKTYYTTHTEDEKIWYSCKTCEKYRTEFNSTMRDHVNSKHMRIMLKCTHCEFETLRFKTLNFHRRSKHNLSAMACVVEKCGFKSILVEKLRDHLVKRHKFEREDAKERIGSMLNEQAVDGSVASCNLDEELQMQAGKPRRMKSNKVVWSGTGWKGRGQRKTDEERQYRILLDEEGKMKGAQCLYCDFVTRLPSNMPGHVNSKHLGKQLKCPECSFSTFYPKNLAVHMKKLHGRNTRKCVVPDCKFRCIQDERMHIHLMEKHNCIYDEVKNAIYIDI